VRAALQTALMRERIATRRRSRGWPCRTCPSWHRRRAARISSAAIASRV